MFKGLYAVLLIAIVYFSCMATSEAGLKAVSSSGSGGSVTWPTSGDAVISNGTSSPAGVAEVDGDCLVGSTGAWIAGSCSGSASTGFANLTNGTNTTAAMVVGSGASLAASGTGTIGATTATKAGSLSISGQTGLLSFTGLTSTNRQITVEDAADTMLELGGSYTPTGTWTSMTLVTPALGTPASGVATNLTGTASALNIGGTAAVATKGTTVAVSNSASYYPLFAASSSNGNQPFNLGTGLSFNPSTNVLTTTTFSGALSGNATTASTVATINGLITQGTNITITGSGTSGSPYSIAASGGSATTSLAGLTTNVLFDANGNINLGNATAMFSGANYNTYVGNGYTGNPSGSTAATTSNTGIGYDSLGAMTSGSNDTAVGVSSGAGLTTGYLNVAVGENALNIATTDAYAVAVGENALAAQNTAGTTIAAANTAIGTTAGATLSTGTGNVFLGAAAGNANTIHCTTCTNAVIIGAGANISAATTANEIVIGQGATGLGANQTVIGNSSTTSARIYGMTGQIGATFSGGGAAIAAGAKTWVYVPQGVTITASTIACDQSGSIVFGITSAAYASFSTTSMPSIVASDPPTLSSAQTAQNTTLTGWTTGITAGNYILFSVTSASTVTNCNIVLNTART